MSRDAPEEEDRPEDSPEIGRTLFKAGMGPSSAFAHLYRGEIHRMKAWRERLDRTTNWAVVVLAALLTWAFSSPDNPHYILVVGMAVLGAFLGIEARRYRGYDIWRSRVRLMQQNVFAFALDPSHGLVDSEWRKKLGKDYRTPRMKITAEEAVAHRLRRIYLPLFLILLGAWVVRVTAFSTVPWPESAAVGQIPGLLVTAAVVACYALMIAVAYRPRTWHTRGELLMEDLRKK
jgi:uncharacterized membrane protein